MQAQDDTRDLGVWPPGLAFCTEWLPRLFEMLLPLSHFPAPVSTPPWLLPCPLPSLLSPSLSSRTASRPVLLRMSLPSQGQAALRAWQCIDWDCTLSRQGEPPQVGSFYYTSQKASVVLSI